MNRFAIAFARSGVPVGAVNTPKDLIRLQRATVAADRLDAVA
ncbi:hypothetical protein ACGFNP_03960 [Nonomuraea sp. NPDC049269]